MTPEEIEELRALVVRLNGDNMAAILGAALEHIDQQAAQLAECRRPMESMDTEQLSQWNVELSTLLCMPVSDRENLWWQIAVGDHLEKFAKSWHSSRIKELEVQVAALQEIAVSERANTLFNGPWDGGLPVGASYDATMAKAKEDARRQLEEKHPEAFK